MEKSVSILAKLVTSIRGEGLSVPELPTHVQWRNVSDHAISSRELPAGLYALPMHLSEAMSGSAFDYWAIGFDGHGINSWAFHYFRVAGPLTLFLQHRWGNVFDNPEYARERIEASIEAIPLLEAALSTAQREGRISPDHRLCLCSSDFSQPGWGWIGQPESWKVTGDLVFLDAIGALVAPNY
jgi:hypothetical protein